MPKACACSNLLPGWCRCSPELREGLASSTNGVVIGAFALEKKMHYPVMTEKQLATRWKISVKTLRRWRLDMTGLVWRKLFRYVRYPGDDVLEFERQSAQHWILLEL
jgi:hypothetical protein